MRTNVSILLVIVVLVAGAARAETQLRVMSFNVRYGDAFDLGNMWKQRKEIVVDTIRSQEPDILGVQECLDYQTDYIDNALPGYHWFGVGREPDGGGEMMAVFYRKDKLDPIETGNFWLSEKPGEPGSKSWKTHCSRMVTWARFRHRGTKRFFYFFNTHFDHGSKEARRQSALLLANRAGGIANDEPAIITGDFNAKGQRSEPWTTMELHGFEDAWLAAKETAGPPVTFGGFKPPPRDADEARIDWVLVRGPIQVDRCETLLFNRDGRYPSDHYPIVADLRIVDNR